MRRLNPLATIPLLAALALASCTDSKPSATGGADGATKDDQDSSASVSLADAFSDGLESQGVKLSPLPAPPSMATPSAAPKDGELSISAVRPNGEGVMARTIAITFNRPVATLQGAEVMAPPDIATIEPRIEGEWRWLGSTTAEFTPKAGMLPKANKFKVTVREGVKALDGSVTDAPFEFTFSTPNPSVTDAEPSGGEKMMPLDTPVAIITNQPVKDIERHAWLNAGGKKIGLTLKKSVLEAEYRREKAKANGDWYDESEEIRPDGAMRYEFVPKEKLPKSSSVSIKVDDQLESASGPGKVEDAWESSFTTHGDQKIVAAYPCGSGEWDSSHCSFGPVFLATGTPVDIDSLKERIKIEPEVELNWDDASTGKPMSWDDSDTAWVRVPGRFRPGQEYTVTVAAGVKDAFGQASAEPFEGKVAMKDRDPYLFVGNSTALLEKNGDRTIPVSTVNAESTKVRMWKLTAEEMAAQMAYERWSDKPRPAVAAEPVEMDIDLTGAKNQTHFAPIRLDPVLFEESKSGFAMVEVQDLNWKDGVKPDVVLVQVTDLAVHVHLGPQDGLAWVTSLSEGKSVAGAALRLIAPDGKVLWSGEANDEGVATMPGLVALMPKEEKDGDFNWQAPELLMVASKDGDEGAVWTRWNDGIAAGDFDSVYNAWEGSSPDSEGVLFTERGIYRPGDPLYVKGVSRYFKNGLLYAPVENARVTLTVSDSDGNTFYTNKKLKLSAYGTFEDTITLPKDKGLGSYSVSAKVHQSGTDMNLWSSFRVEEFRAPQFMVDVVAPEKDLTAGDKVQATATARYLFGGAMQNADVEWNANRNRIAFEPPKNQGFSFGDNSWGWDDGASGSSFAQVGKGTGKLDAMGAYHVDLGDAALSDGATWSYEVEAQITDVNRQRLANRTSITVHPAQAYAGVKLVKNGFAEEGKAMDMELVAAAPDGKRLDGMDISVKVLRREWKVIRKKGVGGEWFTDSQPQDEEVHACKVKSLADAGKAASCQFTPAKPGLHMVEATVTDAKGHTQKTRESFYVIGKGFISWNQNDDKRLELVADKSTYDIGDTAKVLVKSPWPEAEALVTVERAGILYRRQMTVKGSATAISIPIKEIHIPDAFVSVTMVKGRAKGEDGAPDFKPGADSGRPDIRVGYVRLKVENKSKRLKVAVAPDRDEYKPRDKVKVSVDVKDYRDHEMDSEVLVWAVDEGVLRLTNYSMPDLVSSIHHDRGLSVRNASSLIQLVISRLYGDKGADAGGSGGKDASGSGLRSKFVTSPLFKTVVTDGHGHADVEFELPDNLTTYRIMALAVTKKDLFGTAESKLTVSKPLLAMPALSRFALSGDTIEAGVVLHRRGTATSPVTVKATAQGVQLLEADTKSVELKQGEPKEVRFRFRAVTPGEASLRFDIEGEGGSDAVLQKFPVSLPVQREAVATAGSTASEVTEGVEVPAGVLSDRGGLELTFSTTLLGGMDGGMKQLVEYPYGCAEQLSSRLIPFVVLRELYGKFGVPYEAPKEAGQKHPFLSWLSEESLSIQGTKDPDEVVKKTISAIQKLQTSSGAFRYWPSSTWPNAEASVYATLALGRAAAVGYPVDKDALKKAKKFLADEIASGKFRVCPWSYCPQVGPSTRVFALYALAHLGAPQASYYQTFFNDRKKLDLEDRALLASAITAGGKDDGAMGQTILDELTAMGQETPTDIHFSTTSDEGVQEGWGSPVRTNALILQTLANWKPDHPWVQKLSTWVMGSRLRNGEYRNTQEAAFALMALGDVSRATEKEAPDFTAKAILGEAEVASAAFKGHSMSVEKITVPMADMMSKTAGKGGALKLVRDGQAGTLRYGVRMSYYPKRMATMPLERGLTVQRWFEPWTGGGQSRGFKAGELIRVKVRVATPMARKFLVVNVPLPAGLEAVDTSLASTGSLPESEEEAASAMDNGFFSYFNHKELRDDRILAFADELPAGVHSLEFPVRATTPGDFQLMPATAELMYAPEVFGRSDGGSFSVVIGEGK